MPKGCTLSVTNQNAKLLEIYVELQTLKLASYPNAIAVLLRVFMEMSVDHYLEARGISFECGPSQSKQGWANGFQDTRREGEGSEGGYDWQWSRQKGFLDDRQGIVRSKRSRFPTFNTHTFTTDFLLPISAILSSHGTMLNHSS